MDDGKFRSSQQQNANISEGSRYAKEESSYQEASPVTAVRQGKNTLVSENINFQKPHQFKTEMIDEQKTLKSPIRPSSGRRQDDEYQDKIGLFSGLRENYAWCSGR